MNKSNNPKREKLKKLLFSLLALYLIGTTSLTGYAVITGHVPNVLTSLNRLFSVPSAGGNQVNNNPIDLQTVNSEPGINPSAISPADPTSPVSSSQDTSSVDPDAKITDSHTSNTYPTEPVSVTVSQDTTSTPSNPTSGSSSSRTKTSSKPAPSAPPASSSSGPVSSSPSSAASSIPSSPHYSSGSGSKSYSITSVALDKAVMTLNKGDISPSLVAAISPANATGDKTITWTTDNPAIVTIDSTGHVTAVGAGKTQVNAQTANGKTAACTVTVLVPPTTIQINSDDFSLDRGSSITLTATVGPEDCTDKSVQWATSNNDVATVDADGKVTALTAGEATITATTADGKLSDSIAVNGVISIAKLALNKTETSLIKGTTEALTATIDPPDTTEEKSVQWTSTDPSIATVDSSGTITAVEGGTTVITAQVGSHVAECTVTVTVPASGIVVNKATATLAKGTDETLVATVFPEDASNKTVTWSSSDPAVATVDDSGKVTTVNVGTATITATTHDGAYTASCTVTVVIPVTGVTLDKSTLSLIKGDNATLTATIEPLDATDQAVTWESSDPAVSTVDDTGHVTAVEGGTTTIKVTTHDGGFSATCSVTVTVPVSGITLDKATLTLVKGTNGILTATITPTDASNKNVLWSSTDSSVCSVDASGNLTAANTGTTTITATSEDGGYTASCTVTVVIPVTGVTLDKSTLGLIKGDNATLTANIAPVDATDQAVTWESSDSAVATVDSTGHVTAVEGGSATIKVTTHDGGFSASCSITVTVPVSGIALDKSALTLIKGTNGQLTATITPTDATDKNVLWSSSDSNICSVDAAGNLTAVNAGTATITATSEDGGFAATCVVTVVIPVQGVTLDKSTVLYIKGTSGALVATINPSDATDKAVIWSSSNTGIVTVDSTGHVTAVGGGTATISVKTHDGGFTASCTVTVTVPVTGVMLNKTSLSLVKGESDILSATITPVDATDKGITWTSSNPSIVTVDNTGAVTAVGSGVAQITATAHDGGYTAVCTVTTAVTWTYTDELTDIVKENQLRGHGCDASRSAYISVEMGGTTGGINRADGTSVTTYNFTYPLMMHAGQSLSITYTSSASVVYGSAAVIVNGSTVFSARQRAPGSAVYTFSTDTAITQIQVMVQAQTTDHIHDTACGQVNVVVNSDFGAVLLNNSGTSIQ